MLNMTWPSVGQRFQTKSGYWYTVISIKNSNHILIKFDLDDIEKIVQKGNIKTGSIRLPKYRVGQKYLDKNGEYAEIINLEKSIATFKWEDGTTRKCQIGVIPAGTLMKSEDSRRLNPKIKVGSVWYNLSGSKFVVLEKLGKQKWKIAFSEPVYYEDVVDNSNILSGYINNKFKPSVAGKGYLGLYPVDTKSKMYRSWSSMLKRVYNSVTPTAIVTYEDCEVNEQWFNIENYAKWFYKQIVQEDWQLDKDLLVPKNKVYSEDTCVFLPKEINTFLTDRANHRGKWPVGVTYHARINKWQATCSNVRTGCSYIGVYSSPEEAFNAYKIVKENYAKELAEKWKGIIDNRAIEALLNYNVLQYTS